jgi:hypothetical protein
MLKAPFYGPFQGKTQFLGAQRHAEETKKGPCPDESHDTPTLYILLIYPIVSLYRRYL